MKKRLLAISLILSFSLLANVSPANAKKAKTTTLKTKKMSLKVGQKKKIQMKNKKKKANYVYKTSKKRIAKVSKKGVVTAVKPGKAKITVTEKRNGRKKNIGKVSVTVKASSSKNPSTPSQTGPAPTDPAVSPSPAPGTSPATGALTSPTAKPAASPSAGPSATPYSTPRPVEAFHAEDTPEKLHIKRDGVTYGEQQNVQYFSTTTGKDRNAIVILPPGYTTEKKYPVLYLFHGGMGDEKDWTDGSVATMIGNMIADGTAKEMILVLPNCRCREDDSAQNADGFALEHVQSFDNFINDFRDNLMPFIESSYAVATGRDNTAIAGLSMGGRVSLHIGFSMPDKVGSTGAFSPAYGIFPYTNNGLTEEGLFTEETFTLQDPYRDNTLVMINTGDQDNMVKEEPARYHNALMANGVEHLFYTTSGSHDWKVWRNGFYNFARLLFRDSAYRQFDVPTDFDAAQDGITYGTMDKQTYYSTTTQTTRKVNILLPANYTPEKKYPVLYLLHGIGGDENEWLQGKPLNIIGNLIAKKQAKEMIVVIPNCRARANDRATTEFSLEHYAAFDNFINDLRDNLIPFMKKNYSIAEGRENTAIAGLSMGGRESLNIGLNMPETFGYTAAFSPGFGVFEYTANGVHEDGLFTEETFRLPDEYKDNTLLLINNGISEGGENAIGGTCHKALTKNAIPHMFYVTEGGHDFQVWKHGLYNFAIRIFK